MTIETLKSPNPGNRNGISVIKSKFLSVSSTNTLLAILKVTDARRAVILAGVLYHRFPWRHLPRVNTACAYNHWFPQSFSEAVGLACVAGGISVGVLYCFGGGAARRVGIQVNLKSLAASPPTSHGGSAAKKFPQQQESSQLRRLPLGELFQLHLFLVRSSGGPWYPIALSC